MASPQSSLTNYATKIAALVEAIEGNPNQQNLPTNPAFDTNGMAPEVQFARLELLSVLSDMRQRVLGPAEFAMNNHVTMMHDLWVTDFLNRHNFWAAVPLNSSISYSELSNSLSLPESIIRRILRHAFTVHFFCESPPGSGQVAHTASSAFNARNPLMRAWYGHPLEDVAPAMHDVSECIQRFGASEHPGEAAVMFHHLKGEARKDMTCFDWFSEDGEGENKGFRMKRFGDMMKFGAESLLFSIKPINDALDWDGLGEDALVVDVGGSVGHAAIELAREHANLKLIVQDVPGLEDAFYDTVPLDLKSRVTYQVHDFFTPQPVEGAACYLLKQILHDWSDTYATKILRGIAPAMKPGSRVLIIDPQMPLPGTVPGHILKMMSALDLQMMLTMNSKERTAGEWKTLIEGADARFKLIAVKQPPGAPSAYMEVGWEV